MLLAQPFIDLELKVCYIYKLGKLIRLDHYIPKAERVAFWKNLLDC